MQQFLEPIQHTGFSDDEDDSELQFHDLHDDDEEDTVNFASEPNAVTTSVGESSALNLNSRSKRGRQNFITARLCSALDKAKISDGAAVHILVAAAEALGHRVEELVINRSSLHRSRQENRQQESAEIQADFSDNVIEFIFFIYRSSRCNKNNNSTNLRIFDFR